MATFAEMFREARKTDTYWTEIAILEFTTSIYAEMKRQGKSYSDMARILDISPAYITKVFRGNANFTIQSMVKLSRALGCRFHAKAIHVNDHVNWFRSYSNKESAGFADNYSLTTTNGVCYNANKDCAA